MHTRARSIRRPLLGIAAAAALLAGSATGQLPANESPPWMALPSGGGTASSEDFAVKGTIGQAAADVSASANYRVEAGFLAGFAASATEPSVPAGNVWMVW